MISQLAEWELYDSSIRQAFSRLIIDHVSCSGNLHCAVVREHVLKPSKLTQNAHLWLFTGRARMYIYHTLHYIMVISQKSE